MCSIIPHYHLHLDSYLALTHTHSLLSLLSGVSITSLCCPASDNITVLSTFSFDNIIRVNTVVTVYIVWCNHKYINLMLALL